MSWFLRLLGWATVLSALCWFAAPPYQRALAAIASVLLQLLGMPVRVTGLGVAMPFEIGLFAALSLASVRSRPAERFRALALGVPLLVAIEVIVVTGALALDVRAAADPHAAAALRSIAAQLRESVVWASAIAAWLALLGARELPFPRAGSRA